MKRSKNQRLSLEEKEELKSLTLEGKSLRYISKELGLGITTIYYQVRKFKARRKKDFIINLSSEKIGELIGAFAGDGSFYYSRNDKSDLKKGGQYKIRYHLCLSLDYNYALYIRDLLTFLNLNPHIFIRKDNVIDVAVSSKDYILFIKDYLEWEGKKTYSVRLKDKFDNYSLDFLKGFARGLMDTDGYVEVSNVSCACTSKELIRNLKLIFDMLDIKYKFSIRKRENKKDLHLVRVYRESLEKYLENIGFENKYKLDSLKNILNKKLLRKI